MTMHDHPHVSGMGAFEGIQSATLWRQKITRKAKIAVADLDNEALALVVIEELRRRPSWVVASILHEVTK